jgi:hypothetical protein
MHPVPPSILVEHPVTEVVMIPVASEIKPLEFAVKCSKNDVTHIGNLTIKWMPSPAVAPHKRYALHKLPQS